MKETVDVFEALLRIIDRIFSLIEKNPVMSVFILIGIVLVIFLIKCFEYNTKFAYEEKTRKAINEDKEIKQKQNIEQQRLFWENQANRASNRDIFPIVDEVSGALNQFFNSIKLGGGAPNLQLSSQAKDVMEALILKKIPSVKGLYKQENSLNKLLQIIQSERQKGNNNVISECAQFSVDFSNNLQLCYKMLTELAVSKLSSN